MSISRDNTKPQLRTNKRPRRWRIVVLTALSLVVVAGLLSLWRLSNSPIKITISPEITRETEPLRSDGWLDFPQIINRRASTGVSKEENAAIELWRAIGPVPNGAPMEFHEQICAVWGTKPLPTDGEYFVTLQTFLRSRRPQNELFGADAELPSDLENVTQRPWSAEEFPEEAAWLDANRRPLKIVQQAVMRPKYFRPVVVNDGHLLMEALLPDAQAYRGVTDALCAHAMMRVANQDFDGAFADIATTHRLAEHVAHENWLIVFAVALEIEQKAFGCETSILSEMRFSAPEARYRREQLVTVADLRNPADILDFSERFSLLDTSHAILTERMEDAKLRDPISHLLWRTVDWSPALTEVQSRIDQAVEALRTEDPLEFRRRADELLDMIRKELPHKLAGRITATDFVFRRRELAKRTGRGIVALLLPAFQSIRVNMTRNRARADMLRLGYALLEYRALHGRFPDQADRLVPEILEAIPQDGFSEKPFLVTLTENSFVIRGVGVDGVMASEDDESSDDLLIRFGAGSRSGKEQTQDEEDH